LPWLVVVTLAGCSSPEQSEGDTAGPADTAGETSGDTAGDTSRDSGTAETVSVTYSVWTAEQGCWATETADLPSEYWWAYAQDSTVGCDDVEWYMADGDRCLLFSAVCGDDAWSDPEFASTAEQDAACVDVYQHTQAGDIRGCP
jgi:hypothetical protein